VPRPIRRAAVVCLAVASLASLAAPRPARPEPATRNLAFKAQLNDYAPSPGGQNYSACWSYVHSDGREYAAIGVNGISPPPAGTAIYNVTDPSAPHLVGFIPGPPSIWREMKSYRDWLYVVSEGTGSGYGLQIIRMTDPENPVLAATYTTGFIRSHTVSVDTTRGLLVCNGTRNLSGYATGTRILALNEPGIGATPESPVELSWWPGGAIPVSENDYVHDSVPVGNRLYASSIYPGIQRVLDITDPTAPAELASWSYPGGFTHNAWPDATGSWLYVTDEVKGEPLKIFDITNLAAPVLANTITSNPQAIVHNAHVKGDELFLSNYTEGIRVLDLSDPCHPAEFAWADSYSGPSGGYSGVWEVGPFFPSGTVIASDRNSGLYVYRLEHDYGVLRARVVNGGAGPGVPFPDVEVHLTTLGDSLSTPADGVVQFAPGPGTHTVLAHKFGYYEAQETRTVSVGSRDTVDLVLFPRPSVVFTGTVRDQASEAPLEGAEVSLAYTDVHEHTDPSGVYSMNVPDDQYLLEVRRGGYVPLTVVRRIGPGFPGQDYSLAPAPVWDPLESAAGWTIGAAGDDATAGIWTRVVPQGTGPRPASGAASAPLRGGYLDRAPRPANPGLRELLAETVFAESIPVDRVHRDGGGVLPLHEGEAPVAIPNMAPYLDHTPGSGSYCFVTGNSADSVNVNAADVDNGKTSLTTPSLDCTGMAEPTLGFWRWFASFFPTGTSSGHDGPDPDDYLAVLVSDDGGVTWAVVDTIRGLENHWTEETVRVADHVTPSSQVRLRFVAVDGGAATACEAGIDDLVLYDAAGAPVGALPPDRAVRLSFRAPWPNPAAGPVRLVLELPVAGDAAVDVVDVAGRVVRSLVRGPAPAGPLALTWDGRDAAGRPAPAGLYFARASAGAERASARIVRVR